MQLKRNTHNTLQPDSTNITARYKMSAIFSFLCPLEFYKVVHVRSIILLKYMLKDVEMWNTELGLRRFQTIEGLNGVNGLQRDRLKF